MVASYFYFRSEKFAQTIRSGTFGGVEKIFSILMLLTACAMALPGSNDVANAIGPLSAVVSIVDNGGEIMARSPLAWWILPLGAAGIALGLIVMGYKVMATIGTGNYRSHSKPWFCSSICYCYHCSFSIRNRITNFYYSDTRRSNFRYWFCSRYCSS